MTPMLIVLSGLPATDKSVLAAQLGWRLGLPVFSIDPIESAILRAGLTPSFETGLAAYLVAETLADAQLAMRQGAIVDAVNAVEPAKAMWRGLAARHGVPLRVIKCTCSVEALHRVRFAERRREFAPNFPEPTWDDVLRRSGEWTHWTEPVLVVDAAATLDENVARALAWIA